MKICNVPKYHFARHFLSPNSPRVVLVWPIRNSYVSVFRKKGELFFSFSPSNYSCQLAWTNSSSRSNKLFPPHPLTPTRWLCVLYFQVLVRLQYFLICGGFFVPTFPEEILKLQISYHGLNKKSHNCSHLTPKVRCFSWVVECGFMLSSPLLLTPRNASQ